MPFKVLLTGFEPFGLFLVNPSQRLAETFTTSLPIELETLVLPVEFSASQPLYQEKLDRFQPDLILNTGLDARNQGLGLEAIALNIKAEKGSSVYETIQPRKENALFTNLPIQALIEQLCKKQVPTFRSNHAGTYLCNFTYYQSLQWCQKKGGAALFIHLPFTTAMASELCLTYQKTYASLPLALMQKGIEAIIQFQLNPITDRPLKQNTSPQKQIVKTDSLPVLVFNYIRKAILKI